MSKHHRRVLAWVATALFVGALAGVTAAGCGGGSSKSSSLYTTTNCRNLPTSIGRGEGTLSLIARTDTRNPKWVKPFEKQTGCKVNPKYAGSSDEMVTLMRPGGGGQYDMVSASGDATCGSSTAGDVQTGRTRQIPDFTDFNQVPQDAAEQHRRRQALRRLAPVGPEHVALQDRHIQVRRPRRGATIYNPKYKGQITVPNNPIQIADAALYLLEDESRASASPIPTAEPGRSSTRRSTLLKKQKPLDQEVLGPRLRRDRPVPEPRGRRRRGVAVPDGHAQGRQIPADDLIPREGATGWPDTWLLVRPRRRIPTAPTSGCMSSRPKPQAQQAISFGETPVNKMACRSWTSSRGARCARTTRTSRCVLPSR